MLAGLLCWMRATVFWIQKQVNPSVFTCARSLYRQTASIRLRQGYGVIAIAGPAKSHVVDNIRPKFAALDFGRTIHQPREIVSHAFARDRALQSFQDQVGCFRPAHVRNIISPERITEPGFTLSWFA